MNIILEDDTVYRKKVKDFGVVPINKRIITTGEKLVFFKEGKVEKEIGGKVKNCEIIKYIKDKNQLFVSGIFFVSTAAGKVYKCDSRRKKIVEEVFDFDRIPEALEFTTSGKIIYISNNILYSYDTDSKEMISRKCFKSQNIRGNYRIFTSGENITVKYRKLHENVNRITIFDNTLEKMFSVKTENNHIHSKIIGLEYIAGTDTGEIEIWDILDSELYDSIKISDFRITYIEKLEENYIIGTGNGGLVITDEKFNIQNVQNILTGEIIKICGIKDEIYVLSTENRILRFKVDFKKNLIKL